MTIFLNVKKKIFFLFFQSKYYKKKLMLFPPNNFIIIKHIFVLIKDSVIINNFKIGKQHELCINFFLVFDLNLINIMYKKFSKDEIG